MGGCKAAAARSSSSPPHHRFTASRAFTRNSANTGNGALGDRWLLHSANGESGCTNDQSCNYIIIKMKQPFAAVIDPTVPAYPNHRIPRSLRASPRAPKNASPRPPHKKTKHTSNNTKHTLKLYILLILTRSRRHRAPSKARRAMTFRLEGQLMQATILAISRCMAATVDLARAAAGAHVGIQS